MIELKNIFIPIVSSVYIFFTVSSVNNTNESGCQPLVDPLSGCVDTVQPTELSDVFTFKFLKCYSPYVDAINLDHGTFSDVITFDGNGFGTEVLFFIIEVYSWAC